jgi:flagellar biosynthesis GTPase FlhF
MSSRSASPLRRSARDISGYGQRGWQGGEAVRGEWRAGGNNKKGAGERAEQTQSTKHKAQSAKHRAQSTEHRAQSTKHKAQSTEHKAQSTKHRAQSTEHRAQSTEHRAQSTEHRAQSTEHRAQSTEHKAQSTEHKAQSTKHRAQSTKHRAQSTEHRAQSSRAAGVAPDPRAARDWKETGNFSGLWIFGGKGLTSPLLPRQVHVLVTLGLLRDLDQAAAPTRRLARASLSLALWSHSSILAHGQLFGFYR